MATGESWTGNLTFGVTDPTPRRGQPHHHVLVWLERDDEPIPPPWTGGVTRRFFDHATATFGVVVESPDIPWVASPGMHLMEYPSWEALDTAIRQHILDEVARTLPNMNPVVEEQNAQARIGTQMNPSLLGGRIGWLGGWWK